MKKIISYRFRLKPTEEQIDLLKQHGGNIRFVWNQLLDYSNEKFKTSKKFPLKSNYKNKFF